MNNKLNLEKNLYKWFGLTDFRPLQKEIIETVLNHPKKDLFVLMPTGGGKSLCYQLPAVMSSGLTIVVSPLISLIEDQVMALLAKSIPSASFFGEMDDKDKLNVLEAISKNKLKLLYTTPESLTQSTDLVDTLIDLYENNKLSRWVIDEVHAVSTWGHDFRPNYLSLKSLKKQYPDVGMTLLTATARPATQIDVVNSLGLDLKSIKWFQTSFWKSNLRFHVLIKTPDPVDQVSRIILERQRKHGLETGIVYCLSRVECQTMCRELQSKGIRAEFYHAGILGVEKKRILTDWLKDQIQVVVATIAFGLGIDKPDVRYVIHQSIPSSLEGYYQEAGRAGRDGKSSICYLLYSGSDIRRWERISPEQTHLIENVEKFAENHWDCRLRLLVEYLGEKCSEPTKDCGQCDNCRRPNGTDIEVKGVINWIRNLPIDVIYSEGHLLNVLSKLRDLRKWTRYEILRLIVFSWRIGVLTRIESEGYYKVTETKSPISSVKLRVDSTRNLNDVSQICPETPKIDTESFDIADQIIEFELHIEKK